MDNLFDRVHDFLSRIGAFSLVNIAVDPVSDLFHKLIPLLVPDLGDGGSRAIVTGLIPAGKAVLVCLFELVGRQFRFL